MTYTEYLIYVANASEPIRAWPWWTAPLTGAVYAVAGALFVGAAYFLARTIRAESASEPIRGRIGDAIAYLFIVEALINEATN